MVTESDVVAVFRHLLRREPEQAAIDNFVKLERLDDVLQAVLHSDEAALVRLPRYHPCFLYYSQVDLVKIIRDHEDKARRSIQDRFVSFFGVVANTWHLPIMEKAGAVEGSPMPANWHADMAEFGAALRAVDLAHGTFRVIELGCGWGCWLLTTSVAARRKGLSCVMIGVEGDEKHVGYAEQAMVENGFTHQDFKIHHAIASGKRGRAIFPRQNCVEGHTSWGLEPVFDPSESAVQEAEASGCFVVLPTLSIADLLEDADVADLLHIDIQGGEASLVEASIESLNDRVAYMVIGTHSREIEGRLCALLLREGWVLEIERPMIVEFDQGLPTSLIDGVQGWRNPRLRP